MLAYEANHCGVMPLCFQARSQVSSPKLEGHNFPAFSTSTCRTRNSCEQAPAHYTSTRLSAIRSETAWASCEEAPDKLQGRGCKKGNTTHGASSTLRGSHLGLSPTRHCRWQVRFFCLKRLSRHYLPPVAASGEKDESEVRTSRTAQKG